MGDVAQHRGRGDDDALATHLTYQCCKAIIYPRSSRLETWTWSSTLEQALGAGRSHLAGLPSGFEHGRRPPCASRSETHPLASTISFNCKSKRLLTSSRKTIHRGSSFSLTRILCLLKLLTVTVTHLCAPSPRIHPRERIQYSIMIRPFDLTGSYVFNGACGDGRTNEAGTKFFFFFFLWRMQRGTRAQKALS